jgi:transcription antitermination factor NusG
MSQWYALRTATRRERAAHDALTEKGFAVFLPMETLLRKYGRHIEVHEAPLFPGYLFALIDFDQPGAHVAVRTAHTAITGFVQINTPIGPAPMAIPLPAILGLQSEERAGLFNRLPRAKPNAYRPKGGAKVMITTGVWQGFMAKVLQTPRGQRANVLIQLPDGRTKGKTMELKYLRAA